MQVHPLENRLERNDPAHSLFEHAARVAEDGHIVAALSQASRENLRNLVHTSPARRGIAEDYSHSRRRAVIGVNDHPSRLQAPLACIHDSATTDRTCPRIVLDARVGKVLLELRRISRARQMPGLWLGAECRERFCHNCGKAVASISGTVHGDVTASPSSSPLRFLDRRSDCPHYAARVSRRKRVQQASRKLSMLRRTHFLRRDSTIVAVGNHS